MRNWLYISRTEKRKILFLSVLLIVLAGISIISRKNKDLETLPKNSSQELFYTYKKPVLDTSESSEKYNTGDNRDKLNLNIADFEDLLLKLEVDSVIARKILYHRRSIRGYVSISQLIEVEGIDMNLLNKIEDKAYVSPDLHDMICVNQESFESLLQHPYLNYKQCSVIVDIRERKGNIKTIRRLRMLSEFSDRDLERLEPYLSFSPKENYE